VAGGLATVVCAVLLDERDLIRVGAFAALLPLLAALLARYTRRSVRVRRTVTPTRLSVGGPVTVELEVRGGPLLGSLRLADTVPDAAGPLDEAPPRFIVHRVPRRGGVSLRYGLRPTLRGIHRIGPLRARAGDPLGLAALAHELAAADRLVVLPRVVPLTDAPAAFGGGEGTSGAALSHQGKGTSDVLVRPYRHGDEVRRVHWRSTARHDELMVRLEERPWRGGTTVLLDRRDCAHHGRGAGSSLEFAVSLTASIALHLLRRGDPITVVTEDGAELAGPHTPGGGEALLDALAALRPSARQDLAGPARRPAAGLIAVLGTLGPGDLDALLAHRATGGHAVLLEEESAAVLRRAGWQVAVTGAGSTPEGIWSELVRVSSGASTGGRR
jgi:uncharacterized protein (DUF58 family)